MTTARRWHGQAAPIWDASPPPPKVRKYDRLRVITFKPIDLWILNEQLEETWTHFVDDRTVFCSGPETGCWLDHSTTGNARYGAWLAVQPCVNRETFLLRLTGTAVTIEARLREFKGHLRGQHLQVWRKHGHEKSEMQSRLKATPEHLDDLQPSIDVRYCVERMIKGDDRSDGRNAAKWGKLSAAAKAAEGGLHPQLGAH